MTKPEGEARMDCRDAVGLLPCPFCGSDGEELGRLCDHSEGADNSGPSRRIQCYGCNVEAPFYDTEAEAVAAWNTRALSAPVPTGEGEAVAWGCFQNGQLDERLVYRDERRAGDAAFAFTPSLDVRPLYAHPKPAQGEGVEAFREQVHAIIEPLVLGLATEFSYAERRAFANKKTDEIMAALPPAEVKAETGR